VKAALIILCVLLTLAHPAVAIAVLSAELIVCAVLGCVLVRALRPPSVPSPRRTT
jgi:hypothetical protein